MDISILETRAAGLLSRFDPDGARKARLERPFVIELTGPPKSGKTTTKEKLQQLFRRNGFLVEAPEEGAEAVTWAKRLDPEYNLQTGEYALSATRELCYGSKHKSFHVVILDRAVYDVVFRMEYNRMRGKITEAQQRAIEDYFLLDVNRAMFDCHVILVADPHVALAREKAHALSKKDGETMNAKALIEITDAHERAWKRLGCADDRKLAWHDTSNESPEETAASVLTFVLDRFTARLDEAKEEA
jgi:thymidylate kinase